MRENRKVSSYRHALTLSLSLGYDPKKLKSQYVGSKTYFWVSKVAELKKQQKKRDVVYDRALKLSRITGVPITISTNTHGTDYAVWQRQVRRIQAQRNRQGKQYKQAQARKLQVRPVLAAVKQPDILQRKRTAYRVNALKADIELSRFTTNTIRWKNGSVRREYIHTVPDAIKQLLLDDNLKEIRKQIQQVLKIHRGQIAGRKVQIQVRDTSSDHTISSSFQGIENVLKSIVRDQLGPKAREYRKSEIVFEIGEITIAVFQPPDNIMGGSIARTIEKANSKWHIINPTSKFNCVFQSIACCRNFLHNKTLILDTVEAHKSRVESGRELKSKVKPTNDNFANNLTVQEIANWTRYPVKLYDNTFKLINSFTPINPLLRYRTPIKYYEIQKVGDHCHALIDKKIIQAKYPDFKFNTIEKKSDCTAQQAEEFSQLTNLSKDDPRYPMWQKYIFNNSDIPIEKKKCYDEYNYKIASWDIETTNNDKGEHIPYACSIAWFDYEFGEDNVTLCDKKVDGVWKKVEKRTKNIVGSKPQEKQFWGLDCLQRMTSYIHSNPDRFSGYTLYAHNGGKYDLPLAIKRAFLESPDFLIEGKGCLELNNAWIGFTLRSKNDRKFKLYFRDSYRLLPMGLDKLTRELKVAHPKLTETVKHEDINLQNYKTFPQLKTYLTHDVFGLLEVVQKFGQGVFADLGLDITRCYTGASLSKKNYFKNYYDTRFPIYKLSDSNDKFIRNSYFGGRVECFKLGNINKCFYYDFTSLYPAVGRKNLPYGKPEIVALHGANRLDKDFFGWVECMVRTKNENHIPKHCVVQDNRLIFPVFENWTRISLFSEELDYDQYRYEFITGVKFSKKRIKQKFFNDGFSKKSEAKADGNPAMQQAYKIIINSGYGFWGLRTKDRDGVIICEPNSHEYMNYLNTDKLLGFRQLDNYSICRVKKDLDVSDFNVAIAAAISSYARSNLHELLTEIKNTPGGAVYYCDTDSIICNVDIKKHRNLQKNFQWDGDGSELGSLKNECDEKIEKIVIKENPNFTKEQIENEMNILRTTEGGDFSFDKGVITGCKQYALHKTLRYRGRDHPIDIVICKGYSQSSKKLKYKKMETLVAGGTFSQNQNQFRCGKDSYISETNPFTIKTLKIRKSFRKIYTKGVVTSSGDIKPHRI